MWWREGEGVQSQILSFFIYYFPVMGNRGLEKQRSHRVEIVALLPTSYVTLMSPHTSVPLFLHL